MKIEARRAARSHDVLYELEISVFKDKLLDCSSISHVIIWESDWTHRNLRFTVYQVVSCSYCRWNLIWEMLRPSQSCRGFVWGDFLDTTEPCLSAAGLVLLFVSVQTVEKTTRQKKEMWSLKRPNPPRPKGRQTAPDAHWLWQRLTDDPTRVFRGPVPQRPSPGQILLHKKNQHTASWAAHQWVRPIHNMNCTIIHPLHISCLWIKRCPLQSITTRIMYVFFPVLFWVRVTQASGCHQADFTVFRNDLMAELVPTRSSARNAEDLTDNWTHWWTRLFVCDVSYNPDCWVESSSRNIRDSIMVLSVAPDCLFSLWWLNQFNITHWATTEVRRTTKETNKTEWMGWDQKSDVLVVAAMKTQREQSLDV